jgi:hypothetical protein
MGIPEAWRRVGAQVTNAEDLSVRGVVIGRPSQMYFDVRTTDGAVVSVTNGQLTQIKLTDAEITRCSTKLSATELLQARIDGAIRATHDTRPATTSATTLRPRTARGG